METPRDFDVCIFHGGCIDGILAAWVIWRMNPDAVFLAYGYTDPLPPVEMIAGQRIILVDFSFKQAGMRFLKQHAARVSVFDHHKTAEAELEPMIASGEIDGMFDMQQSGAGLTWRVFHDNKVDVPWLVSRVEDRDIWRWAYEDSAAVHAYLSTMLPDDLIDKFRVIDAIFQQTYFSTGRLHLVAVGDALVRQRQKDIADLLPKAEHMMTIHGVEVPAANLIPQLASEAGNILARTAPDTFAVIWWADRDYVHFSLRSIPGGTDVSEVAREFGGGGHARAAGFVLSRTLFGDIGKSVRI